MKDDLFEILKDRFESWELVELLDLDVEDILIEFEDEILDKIDEIKELLNIEQEDENNYDQ